MSRDPWAAFHGKRVLLLQGPVGPFFARLAEVLRNVAAEVHKVNFNGGDCLFYREAAIAWCGPMREWPEFLASLLRERQIDIVLLFGDCRPIHRLARKVAVRHGVRIGAFEEGYVRPNFITFEQFGVNGYSRIPRSPQFYRDLPEVETPAETEVGNTFWYAALWAVLYYVASAAARPWFPRYRHHRPLTLSQAGPWLRAAWRKAYYSWKERSALPRLTGPLRKKFFLVALQMSLDSQVRQHSHFRSVNQFIRQVAQSFAGHAPAGFTLVVKHHPLGRGYHDYSRLVSRLRTELGLGDRLLYIHDQHLPTLFDNMRGAVVINSTVGLSALTHGAPLKVCGVAIYDIKGLTFPGSLDDFWRQAETFRPDSALFRRFRTYLIQRTQLSGSFYREINATIRGASAAAWELGHPVEALSLAADAQAEA